MGCSCLGRVVKITSNIDANNLQYSQKKEKRIEEEREKNMEDVLKSYKTKIDIECSHISSSCISISDDDDQECDKRNTENKNRETGVIKNENEIDKNLIII